MLNPVRRKERVRAQSLFSQKSGQWCVSGAERHAAEVSRPLFLALSLYLEQGGTALKPELFVAISFCSAFAAGCLAVFFAPTVFVVPAALLGGMFPLSWLEARVTARAGKFSRDYPSVLLAAASSIKAGMTATAALERAVVLLPGDSLVRREVEQLLAALHRGERKESALQRFGRSIRQADLELFREAFALALENGGRFAPTLERLARVCRDREVLIRSAEVCTATMRMTANVLLAVSPLIVLMISVRTNGYWELFFQHPTANFIASLGIAVIICSYALLRRMSSFKP